MRNVLVTGGAGFVGSHTCKFLYQHGLRPVVIDNLSQGHAEAVRWGPLIIGDLADQTLVASVIDEYQTDAVLHFAGSTDVAESSRNPNKYYQNNVASSISLLESMRSTNVKTIVFSSSAAVYGIPKKIPIGEDHEICPINPYGRSKSIVEHILEDYSRAYELRYIALRYFNAAGADLDGEVGEQHRPETHLIPCAIKAALEGSAMLKVYGNDYQTADGTCIRDYIHVQDLSAGHLAALRYLDAGGSSCCINLGSGIGLSVLQVVDTISRVADRSISVEFAPRRPGDPPVLVADPSRASQLLGFETKYSDLNTIVETAMSYLQAER